PATRQDIVLDGEGTISGRAVDTSRRPVPGADVLVFADAAPGDASTDPGSIERLRAIRARRGSGADAGTRTDEAGRVEIKDLSGGSYQVVVRAKGHEPAAEAPVAPNDPERDYVLEPLGSIGGVVTDELTREPVTRFRVSFTKRQESGDELNEEVV